jgi:hypothetical protein
VDGETDPDRGEACLEQAAWHLAHYSTLKIYLNLKKQKRLGTVAHAYNSSYSGGRHQEDCGLGLTQAES